MDQNRLNYTDCLKIQIYEDFLQSIASVREGTRPDIAFREHEARVYQLRMKVAAAETGHVRQGNVISLVA